SSSTQRGLRSVSIEGTRAEQRLAICGSDETGAHSLAAPEEASARSATSRESRLTRVISVHRPRFFATQIQSDVPRRQTLRLPKQQPAEFLLETLLKAQS